ncbi:MAG: DUF5690 family protein [Planctomycetaceae bacterium]|nr:hypothetical protein [Planctomycetaceae bacterium]
MKTARFDSRTANLLLTAVAAFATYFCMYAYRKPFTAGTFGGEDFFGMGLKTVLVLSQLLGYMVSKFIGIRVISEMRQEYRAGVIIGLILCAEGALIGFAWLPLPWKVLMMFLNGLPLGIIFGLVLSYLEGRRQTEALSAALCASFIVSSGAVKSVGRWLIVDRGFSEFHMPMIVGGLFLLPLLISVWLLRKTPPPDELDCRLRSERPVMTREHRRQFVAAYWPGLSLLIFVYIALTVIRTIRDDFGVEIWHDLGVSQTPSVYATSETLVAVLVTLLNVFAIWITNNLRALRVTLGLMCLAFGMVLLSVFGQESGSLAPFAFMVTCGVGLYIPYVAFHTTVFERLVAASRRPANLGFLMYLADSLGYLGYAAVMIPRTWGKTPETLLPFFKWSLLCVSGLSILALFAAIYYFQRVLEHVEPGDTLEPMPAPYGLQPVPVVLHAQQPLTEPLD